MSEKEITEVEFERFLKEKSEEGRLRILLEHAEKNDKIIQEKSEGIVFNIKKEKKNKMAEFFKKAFQDMKESAKAQHQVDKANFEATRAEARAQWEEAKLTPKQRQEKMQREREEQIAAAKKRTEDANARIEKAKKLKEKKD